MSLRIPIMIGLPEKTSPSDLLEIPAITSAELISGNLWRLTTVESSYCARLVKNGFVADGIEKPFSLWMILQNHAADYRPGTKLMRTLKRAQSGPDGKMLIGVWSAKELSEIEVAEKDSPSVFDLSNSGVKSVPWVMMGESPEECFKLDYRPESKDVEDDMELSPNKFVELKAVG